MHACMHACIHDKIDVNINSGAWFLLHGKSHLPQHKMTVSAAIPEFQIDYLSIAWSAGS